ncbi:MAG: LTA synthase family protein [Rhodanobacter sp.]|nr:MAG: LTA synthase family protein [Rhodanobacter sp.]
MPLNSTQPRPLWRGTVSRIALWLVLAVLFVWLTGVLDGGKGVLPARLFDQPRFPLANALPGLLLASALLAFSRRALLSFGVAFLLQGLLYGVNMLKVANLGTPLLPADFRMVGQLGNGGMHLLGGYLPHSPWPYLLLLTGVGLVVLMWRFEKPLFVQRPRGRRLLAGGVLSLLLLSLLAGMPAWGRIYNGKVLWLEPWSARSTAIHSGLVSELLMFQLHYGQGQRKPDRAAATQLIGQYADALHQAMTASAAGAVQPDIVVVQSESLFDPRIMRGFEHSRFTPNLTRLAAHGISGQLYVPTFGGGTIRTEFEVLTGLSLRYFDNLQFPYLQMNHKTVPGLVRVLNAHGYETVALHGNDPAFWNRTTAFKALGFDRFVSRSSFPGSATMDGKYMADSAMTDEILSQLKDSGPPQFIFAISIEAHGPYDIAPSHLAERDAIKVPDNLTGKARLELQTYLYHIGHADSELGRLVSQLAKRQRPSLVLFYGDHLPALVDSYKITGFVDGQGMLGQAGTWLLVDPHSRGKPKHLDTAAWLLPGELLAQAGIHDNAYFALTSLVGPQLAALTRAPGAAPTATDGTLQRVDRAMASLETLRLNGQLDSLLPKLPKTPSVLRTTNSAVPSTPPVLTPPPE